MGLIRLLHGSCARPEGLQLFGTKGLFLLANVKEVVTAEFLGNKLLNERLGLVHSVKPEENSSQGIC